MPRPPTDTKAFSSLLQIVADLRGPEGCPWDKSQTHQSLAPYTIEESYELAEVLDQASTDQSPHPIDSKIKDELGDVLFQVVLHSQLAEERSAFNFQDVVENLNEKLIRRHPHVFSDVKVKNINEVWIHWEQIKAKEKKATSTSVFDFPKNLPALQRSYKIGVKAEKQKFDWSNSQQVENKFHEEWTELQEAMKSQTQKNIIDEMGDVLFTLAQLSRHLGFEPEQALRKANAKFEARFEIMMKLAYEQGLDWPQLTDSAKESLWQAAKKVLKP